MDLNKEHFIPEEEALMDFPGATMRSDSHSLLTRGCNDDFTNLSINMLSALDPEANIIVQEDELPNIGMSMAQMSLKARCVMYVRSKVRWLNYMTYNFS